MITSSTVARRPVRPEDEPLVRALVLEARPDLSLLPPEVRDEIADLQVRAQRRQYAEDHPSFREDVLVLDGQDVGRLVVAETDAYVRVADLVVAAAYRGRGVASRALTDLLAAAGGRPVRLGVATDNHPAQRLYESLGFVPIGDQQAGRLELERRSDSEEAR